MLGSRLLCARVPLAARAYTDSAVARILNHRVEFHHAERATVKEWSVKRDWNLSWEKPMREISDIFKAQQQFQAQHGVTPAEAAFDNMLQQFQLKYGKMPQEIPNAVDDAAAAELERVAKLVASGAEVSDEVAAVNATTCDKMIDEIDALLAKLEALESSLPDEKCRLSEYPEPLMKAAKEFERAMLMDVLVDPDDEVLGPDSDPAKIAEAELDLEIEPFHRPIPEEEYAEHMLGYDAPIDVENDMREFNQHWSKFSTARLPASPESALAPTEPEDVKQLARLLAEHPGISGEEIGSLLEYYKQVVNNTLVPQQPLETQFPELAYKEVAPWTFKRPVHLPGEELASRVDATGKYADLKSQLRAAIESELSDIDTSDSDESSDEVSSDDKMPGS